MKNLSIPRIVFLSTILAGLLLFSACKTKKTEYPSDTQEVLGTSVTIKLYAEGQLVDSIQRIFDQAFATMSHWEQMTLSAGDINQVRKISEGAGSQSMTVDPDVFEMIMAATRLHDHSGKLFDIRMGPLYDAWGFDSNPVIPDSAALASALELVGDGGMFVAGKSILLAKEGMRFDVRHFVEGYVFDLVATQLQELGFQNFTIASPSVFLAVGTSPDEKGFNFALHHPQISDSIWANLYVQNGGYAFLTQLVGRFEKNDNAYHSLLNPMTGTPVNNFAGVVVHAENAATAQAMATAVFVQDSGQEITEAGRAVIKGSIKVTEESGLFKSETFGTLNAGLELVH